VQLDTAREGSTVRNMVVNHLYLYHSGVSTVFAKQAKYLSVLLHDSLKDVHDTDYI